MPPAHNGSMEKPNKPLKHICFADIDGIDIHNVHF
jgi:hypothetical protein